MYRYLTSAVTVLLVLLSPCNLWAQKIEIDPNTPEAVAEQKVDNSTVDERLAQKITYTSTDKRLHSVIQDISSKSGVTIRCGSSEDDWKVRDLPLVVCAKDIQLGVLLRALADGLHLQLRATRIGDAVSYRIYWDKVLEREVESYYQKCKEAHAAYPNWEWDAWVKLGSTPDADLKHNDVLNDVDPDYDWTRTRALSKLMASLSPEQKAKVFSGEPLKLEAKDLPSPASGYVSDMYASWWRHHIAYQDHAGKDNRSDLTPNELQTARVELKFTDGETPSLTTDMMGPKGRVSPATLMPWGIYWKWVPGLSEPPRVPEPPSAAEKDGLESLNGPAINADSAWIADKVTVARPEGKEELTFADAVAAVSKAFGYSIVCEDFRSHCWNRGFDNIYGDTCLLNAFQGFRFGGVKWFVDRDHKLFVGSSANWCRDHANLVPKDMLDYLRSKLDDEGVELDDAVIIRRLTDSQCENWIYNSRDLNAIAWTASPQSEVIWRFYDSLSPGDKAQAKSDQGLSLGKFDLTYLQGLIKEIAEAAGKTDANQRMGEVVRVNPQLAARVQQTALEVAPELATADQDKIATVDMDEVAEQITERIPELKSMLIVPTDPKVISQLVVKVQRTEVPPFVDIYDGKGGYQVENRPDGFKKHIYSLWITGENTNRVIGNIGIELPVYSRKREAKLWEEMQKKSAEAASKTGDQKQ